MLLKDLAKVIYVHGTASINTPIKVITYSDNRTLWEGKAIDLQDWSNVYGWSVVEVRKNSEREYSEFEMEIPFFNRSWVIIVM